MEITEQDFDLLTTTSMQWGVDWTDQEPRFEMMPGQGVMRYDWAYAYWLNDYASVILARHFLDVCEDLPLQIAYDTISEDFVIVTNYATESWRNG